jgi:hypothetical protein
MRVGWLASTGSNNNLKVSGALGGALNRKLTMNLNVQGAEKPRVDKGSAATNGCDILGCRSSTKAADAMLLFNRTCRKGTARSVRRNARQLN